MASISYTIFAGGNLESVVAGTQIPSTGAGSIEIRMDQTPTAVTDAAFAGGTRAIRKGEIYTAIRILEQYLIRDATIVP